MKIWIGILLLGLAIIGLWVAKCRSAPKPNDVHEFMRLKLENSQKVLEGLAVEDFDLIAKNAQALDLMSKATNWQVLQTEQYVRLSQDFQRTAEAVRDAAKKRNLDGAALGYVELTMQCINCHKYVRDERAQTEKLPASK